MPRQGPRRLPAGERDRHLAEEVLYLHALWHRGPHAPAPGPSLAPPPPAPSRQILAGAAGASAPSTANPPPPKTPPGPPLAQREGFDSEGDRAEEQEAAVYFTGLFQRDAWLRRHYTRRWRKGRFPCLVCAPGGGVGKAARHFRGCLALVQHACHSRRSRGLHGRYGRHGAHRALAAVVCRLLGWDIETLFRRRIVIHPRATAGVQHAKENDVAGENNGFSTDDESYSIDEDEESDDEESVDEEDIEIGIPDPSTDDDEEDSEIENDEDYAEDLENRMEDSSTDGDKDANELEICKEAAQKEDADTGSEGSKITDGDTEAIKLDNTEKPEKEAANSIARKWDIIRGRLLSFTHAKLVGTPPNKTDVQISNRVKEVSTPGSKFYEGTDKAKRKASALSYQGQSSASGVVKKVKVNQRPSNKGKQSNKTNKTGASAPKAKRPAVAARKANQLDMKQLAKKKLTKAARKAKKLAKAARKAKQLAKKQLAKKRKVDA